MAKVFIEETTLTAIGDAIREKTGSTDLIAPGSMPAEIKGIVSGGDGDCNGLHVPEEALVITGNCQYRFAQNSWNWFIEEYGDKITTNGIGATTNMFSGSDTLTSIPFTLNMRIPTASYLSWDMNYMFMNCKALINVPKIMTTKPSAIKGMFDACYQLTTIPDDLIDTWDWSAIDGATTSYSGDTGSMLCHCYNLRNLPTWFFSHMNPVGSYSIATVYCAFQNCYALEKVEGIRLPVNATWTYNAFYNTFSNCCRLKKITFALQEDGSPYVHNISNQTIDLTSVGYLTTTANNNFIKYCSSTYTPDDRIDSWAKWETYFGDSQIDNGTGNGYAYLNDWNTFGRTAVKRMFATLPDVTGGSGNTIKLNANALVSNYAMTGERIADLTGEEIAVATARGWTVTKV